MAKNYLKIFNDGSSKATLIKPSFGKARDAEFAGDNPDVYINGLWYPTSGTDETMTNGDFDLNTDFFFIY